MFGPSLKSVPGCLVSIVPMLIGVPVALTPGFGPHVEVSTDVLPLVPEAVLELDVEPPPPPAELLLELLLPQPASTTNSPSTAMSARPGRTRAEWWYILTLSSPDEGLPARLASDG